MIGDLIRGRGAQKAWMPVGNIDRDMVRAAIAAEDSEFCSHNGFDFEAIEDAMKRNASGGRIRGGSTISQQTAKNAFLWNGGGYARKGVEAWFTFLIEHLWGKRRIMEVLPERRGDRHRDLRSERWFGTLFRPRRERHECNRGCSDRCGAAASKEARSSRSQGLYPSLRQHDRRANPDRCNRRARRLRLQGRRCTSEQGAASSHKAGPARAWRGI